MGIFWLYRFHIGSLVLLVLLGSQISSELVLFPTAGFSHWVYCRGFSEANGGFRHVLFHFLHTFCLLAATPYWDAARGEVL